MGGMWFDGPEYLRAHALCRDTSGTTSSTTIAPSSAHPLVPYKLINGTFNTHDAQNACGPGHRMAMPKTHEQVKDLLVVARAVGTKFSAETGILLGGHET